MKLLVENLRAESVPGASIFVGASQSFHVETSPTIDIPPKETRQFEITYTIPTDAPEGTFTADFFLTTNVNGIDPRPFPLPATLTVDATPPVLGFVDSTGAALRDEAGHLIVDGGTIKSKVVIIQAKDLGGSGIGQVEISGPSPFDPTEYTGDEIADTLFEDLENGNYIVTVKDRAGNSAKIAFTVLIDNVPPSLTVRKQNGVVIPDGEDTDGSTVLVEAADTTGAGQKGLAKISIIGLDPHNDFENHIDFAGDASVSFSTSLPNGDYWIVATDRDGNFSEQTFGIISTTGAVASLYTGGTYLYNEFRGISISTPALVSQDLVGFNSGSGDPIMQGVIQYSFRSVYGTPDRGPRIRQIRATGPNDFNYVHDFDPPVDDSPSLGFPALSAGTYQFTVTDVQEGKTFMPFKIVDLVAYRCPGVTSQFAMVSGTVTYTVSNHFCLKSSLGLKSLHELAANGVPIGGEVGLGGLQSRSYDLPTTVEPNSQRRFTITDIESNANGAFASVAIENTPIGAVSLDGSPSLSSGPFDLKAMGYVPGVRFRAASAAPAMGGSNLAVFIVEYSAVGNIPISNADVTLGSLDVSVDGASVLNGNITMAHTGIVTAPIMDVNATVAVGLSPMLTASVSPNYPVTVFPANCSQVNAQDPGLCDAGTVPYVAKLTSVAGTIVGAYVQVGNGPGDNNVFAGGPMSLSLGSEVELGLPAHDTGLVWKTVTTRAPPLRFKNIPASTAYRITVQAPLSGPATVSLPFSAAGLTAAQLAKLVVLETTSPNPGPEDFVPIPSQVVGGKIVGTTSSFGPTTAVEFMVVAPIHADPEIVENDDLLFQSDRPDVALTPESGSSFAMRKVLAILRAQGLTPVTDIYHVGPDGAQFPVAGVVEMKVDAARLALLGVLRSTLRLIQFNAKGAVLKLPSLSLGTNKLAAKVPFLTSNFAVFGTTTPAYIDMSPPISSLAFNRGGATDGAGQIVIDTQTEISLLAVDPVLPYFMTSGVAQKRILVDEAFVDTVTTPGTLYVSTFTLSTGTHHVVYYSVDNSGNVEPRTFSTLLVTLPDNQPPRTSFVIGLPSATVAGSNFVSSSSLLGFTSSDDRFTLNDGLGVGATQTFYTTDGGAFTQFTSSFSLAVEGSHSISFFSVDRDGNSEAPSARTIFLDMTPPISQLGGNGTNVFSLSAVDPNGAGVGSGVARIRYLVDITTPTACNGVVEDANAARGTCANPWYGGPFTLSGGPHTVIFQAFDAVGNAEAQHSAHAEVNTQVSFAGGQGIGKDNFDAFWTVIRENDGVSFAHATSLGAFISSTTLQDAVGGLPWSVFFDTAGRSYAVGMAGGPGTLALDLAVYKASPAGDAVESRLLFDSGYSNNEIVFDIKAPGWIVGAAQTAGPTDFNAPGERNLSMAIWKFDPSLGTVQLSTASARAGFDFGSGLALDADGSLWIAGYSMRPNAPDVGGMDFALWHYASDGRTLLGGPFLRPGYLSNLDGGITARVYVTGTAVYVAAPRLNALGGTDMAFLKFDKSSGQATAENVWHSADGAPSYPAAVLPEASDVLVVGGIGSNLTEAALWRFGFDGSLQSVTTADAGGAKGAVFRGSELWLSVDGSTSPYRVQTETPASGSLIDILPPRTDLSVGAPTFAGDSTLYVTNASSFGLTAVDDKSIPGDGLGVGTNQTFYAVDGGTYTRFVSSFTLVTEGTHTLSFYSLDLGGLAETPKTQIVGVDLTAPVAALVSSGTIFSITAFDPIIAGAASGVQEINYLVDSVPENCGSVPRSTAAPHGTCANISYAGPFELSAGTHTVLFQGIDRLGNGAEQISSSNVVVGSAFSSVVMVPSTGPIGVPFSLTGSGFGAYGGSNTRVKFGISIAPVSVWNDTTISGTVPGLSTGAYAVTIERQNASSVTVVSAGTFTVTDLSSASLSVSAGPIGVPFAFTGAGFGPYAGTLTRVLVSGTTAPLSVWNDTTISGTIPGVTPGAKTLVIQRATSDGGLVSSSDFAFTVTVPSVATVSPSSGPIGAAFTLSGQSFGPYAGSLTQVLVGGATAPLSLWNDGTITGAVPGALLPGVQPVVVERRTPDGGLSRANTVYFEVTGLGLASLNPSTGPIGVPFAISGVGFGAYNGTNTRVKFGATAAALSLWNDTTILGTVPPLSTGTWTVVVERQQGADISASNLSSFTVTALIPGTLTPSSGPIGAPFTLTGSGFGPYAGTNTRVLIGGATAALSVWNDTTISGTIPTVSSGVQPLRLERVSGAGVQTSDAIDWTVVVPSITAISPSSGPIGVAFTLTGAGFGPYNGANTTVLIGGATAALSLWNDTTITGTVPGSLPTGMKAVSVTRKASDGGVVASNAVDFQVTGMSLNAIVPSSGPIGAPFTITGTQFGAYNGANTRVRIGGVLASLSLWNDTTISGTIPALSTGVLDVVVERQQGANVAMSNISSFTVVALSPTGLTPMTGPIGTAFTLTGSGFGPYAGANTRVVVGNVAAALSLWNDTTIKGTIPAVAAGSQPMWLERASGSGVQSSDTAYFLVTEPAVATLTPSSAPIGASFTITGTSFGAYAGANTRVKFNGVAAPLSVWNDTTITGTVPGALAPGAVELVVERAAGAGLVSSATQAFLVLVPAISTISPVFGPAGTVVTLNGSGFGPYSGTLTKVLVGGATVPLSVWNDTTIRWTVPPSLADGAYPVVVRREPAGGSVESSSATFTVGTGLSGASFAFASTLSLAATPDSHFEGDMALSSTTGGRIDTPAKAAVDIPANAMDADTEITLKRIRADGLRAKAADDIKKHAAGEPIEFGPEGTRFNTPVTIELPYDPALTGDESKVAIHYYNPLRRAWEELPSVVDRARHVVTAKTDHFSIYQPMGLAPTTAAQDEFYLRDVYAYPNPSRNGEAIVFRIQPGLADTVEVRVYDLSGRSIHASTDFTFRGAIDDGNGKGAQNTYDHAWGVSGIGSGVYNYVIKASRSGQKPITRSGKVGVIR